MSQREWCQIISAKIMCENYEGQVSLAWDAVVFITMQERQNGEYKYGMVVLIKGVVTLNLADVGLSANHKLDNFLENLRWTFRICKEALILRPFQKSLKWTLADVSPIHYVKWSFSSFRVRGNQLISFLKMGIQRFP